MIWEEACCHLRYTVSENMCGIIWLIICFSGYDLMNSSVELPNFDVNFDSLYASVVINRIYLNTDAATQASKRKALLLFKIVATHLFSCCFAQFVY